MNNKTESIFIIDDDESVRRSLSLFLKATKYNVETYSSSEEYLAREPYDGIGCLILDVNLGGKTGLELQEDLKINGSHLPIIFITGIGDIHMSVNALKKGAINFLEKPFKDEELLQSISEALAISKKVKAENDELKNARSLIDTLTPKENEVLKYLLTGMLNKQIANELKIAEHTVKLHRMSICEKLGAKSAIEIIHIAEKAGVYPYK
jgi:FixJ family two-component response regulator